MGLIMVSSNFPENYEEIQEAALNVGLSSRTTYEFKAGCKIDR